MENGVIMAKMEFELNDEQIEKVKILEENGISVGEAIDFLFEAKEVALSQMDDVNKNLDVLDKIKDNSLDAEKRMEFLEENYGLSDETYDRKVQDIKHNIKWGKDFFKF